MTALGMKHSVATKTSDGTFHYMSMNVTWTPSVDDGGRDHSLCFYATDDNNG
ncbi:hypothetical protein DPMN_111351 [Dreissena polymorpha]|uniref:Uncharacterized protein n=2 Tax=Dreissena polymorpha TaxID=45954 RepID=A0A9D4QPQ0_DREPO|nr:hypothetical protein DPMN_111351 [Dreissena polymorpha]